MENNVNQKELDTIAKIIFGEAWTEGSEDEAPIIEEAFKAVANTMRNRSLISGKSLAKEATSPNQYSIYLKPKDRKHPDWADWKSIDLIIKSQPKKWAIAQAVARQAIDGTIQDNTGGATYYYNPQVVAPEWAPKFTVTTDIGNHKFLKDPDPASQYSDIKLQQRLKNIHTDTPQSSLASIVPPIKQVGVQQEDGPLVVSGNPSQEDMGYMQFAQKAQDRFNSGKASEKYKAAYNNWITALTPKQKETIKEYLPQDVTKQSSINPPGGKFMSLIVDKLKNKSIERDNHDQWYGSLAPEGQEVINKYFKQNNV